MFRTPIKVDKNVKNQHIKMSIQKTLISVTTFQCTEETNRPMCKIYQKNPDIIPKL